MSLAEELVIISSDVLRRATTPITPRRPQVQKSAKSKREQKQKAQTTSIVLLTPPDSRSRRKTPKSANRLISRDGISNFGAKLAAAAGSQAQKHPSSINDDSVRIVGTRVNISYRAPKHTWKAEERQCLVLLKRFFVADVFAITAILNAVFPKALIPFKSIMVGVQYNELAKGEKSNDDQDRAWDYTWSNTDFDSACREFDEILEKLEEKASEVGVAITRRFEDDQRNLVQANSRLDTIQNRTPRTPRTPKRTVEKSNTKKRLVRPGQSSAIPIPSLGHRSIAPITHQPDVQRQSTVARFSPNAEIQAPEQNGRFYRRILLIYLIIYR